MGKFLVQALFILVLIASIAFGVAATVDAARRPPDDWDAAGRSQKLRFAVFLSPVLAFLCFPVGVVLPAYYYGNVRPRLVTVERRRATGGSRPARRRAFGLGATWTELSLWSKVNVVLAFAGSIALGAVVLSQPDDVPLLGKILLAPIFFIALFFALYFGLWLAQLLLVVLLRLPPGGLLDEKHPGAGNRRRAAGEASRRVAGQEQLARRRAYAAQERLDRERRRQGRG
jgi:hypothetical protein